MNTHFRTASRINDAGFRVLGEIVEGTHQWPANSGQYEITMADGSVRLEWYTVAFGWNDGRLNAHDIVKSKLIMSFKQALDQGLR